MNRLKYLLLPSIAVVIFILIVGYVLESSKSKCLAEGFHGGGGHGGGHGGGGNMWHRNNYNPPVFHGRYGPSTYGGMNSYGYFPIYTEYEYPVYYVNARNNFISDDQGILYYLFHPFAFFSRIFS
jgi:hypothetical protein